MTLKSKRKIKFIISKILGILIIVLTLTIAKLSNKFIETTFSIVIFYVYRNLFKTQWHATSMINCCIITFVILLLIVKIEINIYISCLFSVLLIFFINTISYKMCSNHEILSHKNIRELSFDELYAILQDVDYQVVKIAYNYYHKENTKTALEFAYEQNISEATLYRYLRKVKNELKSLDVKV